MAREPQRILPMQQPRISAKTKIGATLGGGALTALSLALIYLPTDEGKRNVDYMDIAKVPTACYGHTGPDARVGTYRSDAECHALLKQDAQKHLLGALKCSPGLAEDPNQLAAVTRLTFNIGVAGYCKSSIARLFNAGQYRAACDRFLAYRFAGGREVRGLLLRRQRERAQCLTGL